MLYCELVMQDISSCWFYTYICSSETSESESFSLDGFILSGSDLEEK